MRRLHRILQTVLVVCVSLHAGRAAVDSTSAASAGEAANSGDNRFRLWSLADSVAVTYFWQGVTVSPDGSKFFFTRNHGDRVNDNNVFELTVFAATDVRQALTLFSRQPDVLPQPLQCLVRCSSDHSGAEFLRAQWEEDGESIRFGGVDGSGKRQLYRFYIESGKLIALTDWPDGVGLSPWVFGDTVVANVDVPSDGPKPSLGYPMHVVSKEDLLGTNVPSTPSQKPRSFVGHFGKAPSTLSTSEVRTLAAAPSGRKLVSVCAIDPKDVPGSWRNYDRWTLRLIANQVESSELSRFTLIDAERGIDKPLFDAPTGIATQIGLERSRVLPPSALWTKDESRVVLINTALPLTSRQDPDRERMAYVVSYDVENGAWEVIEPLESTDDAGMRRKVAQVGWLKDGDELLVRRECAGNSSLGTVYHLEQGRWVGQEVDATVALPPVSARRSAPILAGGLKVEVRQDMNTPPAVIASDGQHELPLTPPDPALTDKQLARQEPFEWREPGGEMRTGGLLLPQKVGSGAPPLVIQAYKFEPNRFAPDGVVTNGYAGQALVARGMAVLNLTITAHDDSKIATPRELTDFVAEIDSAADALAERGLIDRCRVGLIGFSRGGYCAYYAITHPGKIPLTAAVIDDGFPGTYGYLLSTASVRSGGGLPPINYGGDFWNNKATWLELEPSFNMDRVRTPALFTHHNQWGLKFSLDTVGAFVLSRRPFEFLVFPRGRHSLEMPRERYASQESSVEWMAFWLQGAIPSDPERAARWAILRKQQDEVLKTPPPPKGKWVFQPDPVQPEWHPPAESKKDEPKPEPTGANKN